MSYSRDPNALLEAAGPQREPPKPFPPPLAGRQPVMYRNVRLLRPLGRHRVGAVLPYVEVNWETGRANTYCDADDALNRSADEVVYDAWPWAEPRSGAEYAREVGNLLRRGHSLTDPLCCCEHGLSPERAAELGIAARRRPPCPLSAAQRPWTAARVSFELGVRDILSGQPLLVAPPRAPAMGLLQAMCDAGLLQVQRNTDGTQGVVASAAAHLGRVRNRDELALAIRTAPCVTYAVPPPAERYLAFERDLNELVASGIVLEVPGGEGGRRLVTWSGGPEGRADDDVRRLWRMAAPWLRC